jgi:glycosyltransferase involved in cell wall biosynthesis
MPAERVAVVYEGVDPMEAGAQGDDGAVTRHGLASTPYFIYPAMITPHKNHQILVEAWARLGAGGAPPVLLLTGRETPHLQSLREAAAAAGVSDLIRYIGYVSRSELLGLIANARGLLFPSHFEGFGLPVLEAMQLGTPVVSSTTSSLPEITGDAAVTAGPDDATAWAEGVARLLRDDDFRREVIGRGYRNVRRFSWQQCADETLAVLAEAAQ